MVNPFIVSDKNSKSSKIKNAVLKRIKTHSLSRSNLIIVIGGDGFMLETLKKYNKYKKPFYGINSGNYGFLMNKFSEKTNYKNLIKGRLVSISPLEMRVKNKSNIIKNIPLGRIGDVSDVSELVMFLASEDASYITGQTISVDGGLLMY